MCFVVIVELAYPVSLTHRHTLIPLGNCRQATSAKGSYQLWQVWEASWLWGWEKAAIHSHFWNRGGSTASSPADGSQGNQLHHYTPGDSWTYRVSMTMTAPNGQSLTCDGTMSVHISAAMLGDQKILCDNTNLHVALANGKSFDDLQRIYFTQDIEGNQVEVGDYGGPKNTYRSLSHPTVIMPGVFSDNLNLNCNLNFSNGETEVGSVATTGAAINKTLPDGSAVVCWTLSETNQDADGKQTSTSIYAPGLGSFVDTAVKSIRNDGLVMQYNLTLTSTNVRVGAS